MPTKSPPPGLSLRPASDDDFEALLLLRLAAMRESLEQVGRFDPQRARERLSRGFQPKFTRNILLDGELVGFVVVVPLEDSGEWLLDHLYIHPNAQKLGIGSWVMEQVLQEADRHGKAVRVTALRLSDANRFYQRHGFQLQAEGEWDLYYLRPAPWRPASSGCASRCWGLTRCCAAGPSPRPSRCSNRPGRTTGCGPMPCSMPCCRMVANRSGWASPACPAWARAPSSRPWACT
jgi:GNAT superfamily N-acetyltransferase